MNILFLGYWGIRDGLTASTIVPHLKILAALESVSKIIFCTIERSGTVCDFELNKVVHIPLVAEDHRNVFINKFTDFVRFPKLLASITFNEKVDFLICRSSLAGALGYLVWKKTGIPYIVESFEPHADYMADSGTWSVFDPRYIIQKYFELRQKKTARYLLPVSNNYQKKLIDEGVDEQKIFVMPCCVAVREFLFDPDKRTRIRNLLSIPGNSIVGIYVGKYGDIYYDDEAFALYKQAFEFFGNTFRLLILSGDDPQRIQKQLEAYNIVTRHVVVRYVMHSEVNEYLSAADFAFSTVRPSTHRKYCSPVKNGEYWANGLPILTATGIGDDSEIVNREHAGVVMDIHRPQPAFQTLLQLLKKGRATVASEITPVAYRHRRMEQVEILYRNLIRQG